MIKISDYSLNYSALLSKGEMTLFDFLNRCRDLGLEGASLHIQNMPDLSSGFLKKLRRGYLDRGLSMSMFTVTTNFGDPRDGLKGEFDKALEAIRVGMFLGAPILRVFAGSPKDEADRANAFQRAADGIRAVCQEAAEWGLPVGLQNHNHHHLCRTGDDVIRMIKMVDHPNLTFLLDTGQFAGSKGASAEPPAELRDADFMRSIEQTAPLARHVRVKFYNPRADGSEPNIDYPKVFNILRGVHYQGFVDIVYEPDRFNGDEVRKAMPRIVKFLRKQVLTG